MTTHDDIVAAIETVTHDFIHENPSTHVHDPVEINNGYCRWFLDEVIDYLGDPDDITRYDAHWVHSWIEHNGKHYDAEHPHGVDDPHDLNVWRRLDNETLHALDAEQNPLHADQFPFDVQPTTASQPS